MFTCAVIYVMCDTKAPTSEITIQYQINIHIIMHKTHKSTFIVHCHSKNPYGWLRMLSKGSYKLNLNINSEV